MGGNWPHNAQAIPPSCRKSQLCVLACSGSRSVQIAAEGSFGRSPGSPKPTCLFDVICDLSASTSVIHFCTKRDAPHNRWAYLYTDALLSFDTSGDSISPPDVERAFLNRKMDGAIQKRATGEHIYFEDAISICAQDGNRSDMDGIFDNASPSERSPYDIWKQ